MPFFADHLQNKNFVVNIKIVTCECVLVLTPGHHDMVATLAQHGSLPVKDWIFFILKRVLYMMQNKTNVVKS